MEDDVPMVVDSTESTVPFEDPHSSLEPPNTDEMVSNWTEYVHGGSPHYMGRHSAPADAWADIHLTSSVTLPGCPGEPCSEADRLAQQLLERKAITCEDICQLVGLLMIDSGYAKRAAERAKPEVEETFMFQAGAFVFGGHAGILTGTAKHPWVTVLLCSIVSSLVPGHSFSTVVLSHNVLTAVHNDVHNHRSVDNVVIRLSQWAEGDGVWTRDAEGEEGSRAALFSWGAMCSSMLPKIMPLSHGLVAPALC